ncbi:MAG: hypothetical protein A2Y23_10425 [Clostridiales bacterium GWB2_37_7]|nr:MAG: hypothetical protein A2Y23_10425 [Clostridiales bacterium GWB2_37_7]
MFKKIVLPAVIITAMLTLNTAVFAEPNRSIARRLDVTTFQLTKNLDGTKTFERNQVISGRAERGSEITMTVFWFRADEDMSILSKRRTSDDAEVNGQWILHGKSSWEVGASEIFAKPVTLNPGKNRIAIRVKDKDGNIKDEVINVEFVFKNEVEDFFKSIIMKNLK